jgi:hypothetical protein
MEDQHGPGFRTLQSHRSFPEGGSLWHDQPDAQGGSLGSFKHHRGCSKKAPKGVYQVSADLFRSLSELETQVIISKQLAWLNDQEYSKLIGLINTVRAQMTGLERALQRKL